MKKPNLAISSFLKRKSYYYFKLNTTLHKEIFKNKQISVYRKILSYIFRYFEETFKNANFPAESLKKI